MRKILVWVLGLSALSVLGLAILFYRNTNPEIDSLIEGLGGKHISNLDRMVICIDGVSWSYIQELQAQGYFAMFRPASRVLVTFPAMTNVSLSDIWHTDDTPGYESLYFDKEVNKIGGGATTYIGKRKVKGRDYHSLLDYEEPRQYEFLVYVSPLRIISADIRRAILTLFSLEKREQRYYIKSSDGMIHIRGKSGAERFIRDLDSFLTAMFRSSAGRQIVQGLLISFFPRQQNRSNDLRVLAVVPRMVGSKSQVRKTSLLVSLIAHDSG